MHTVPTTTITECIQRLRVLHYNLLGAKSFGTEASDPGANKDGEEHLTAKSLNQKMVEDPTTGPNKDADEDKGIDGRAQNVPDGSKSLGTEESEPGPNKDGANKDGHKDKGLYNGEQTLLEGTKSSKTEESERGANKDGQEHIMAEGANPNKLEDVNEAAVKATHGTKKRTKRVTPTAMYTKAQKHN